MENVEARSKLISVALALQWATILWMTAEGAIAVYSAIAAHSVSLLGFGLDSFVELISAAVVTRRLYVELRSRAAFDEAVETRAAVIAGSLLFLVAAYLVVAAILSIVHRSGESFTMLGLAVTAISFPFMLWLGHRKKKLGATLESRALRADGAEALACAYLSLTVLIGLAAQFLFGWWWIDAATSLAVVYFLVKEGREAFAGEDCCED